MAQDYVVLAKDFYRVEYKICEKPWEPESALVDAIEKTWQEKKAKDEKKGAICVNGTMARVKSYKEENSVLSLELQYTDWKHFIGVRDIIKDAARCANPLSVGGITVTSDGYIAAGMKSILNEIGAGEYQLAPCGYVDWADVEGKGNGFASAMFRELGEELNITPCRPISFTERPKVRQPMIIAELRVPYDRREIFNAHRKIKEKETSHIEFIEANPEAIERFLKGHEKEIRPHLRCGLEIYRERLLGRKVAAGVPATA